MRDNLLYWPFNHIIWYGVCAIQNSKYK